MLGKLNKLLKYDFKLFGRTLFPIYGITFLMAIFNLILRKLTHVNIVFATLGGFITFFFVLLLIGVLIGTFIISVQKFYRNLLKDEGYLTHTLPVSKKALISSKIITSALFGIISIIVVVVAIQIGFLADFNFFQILCDIFNMKLIEIMSGMVNPWGGIFLLFMLAVSYLSQLLFIYFAISLGQKHCGNTILYSFVYGFVLYAVTQVISLIMMFGIALIDPSIMSNEIVPTSGTLHLLYGTSAILSLIFIAFYWYGTVYMFDKKLNLE